MKGIVRNITDAGLVIPEQPGVNWRVTEGYQDRVVEEGAVSLSSYGGWEAEWKIPEKSKLGHFEIRCQNAGQGYDGRTSISVEEYRC